MREYLIKLVIAIIALYILFKITIGSILNTYFSKIEKLTNQNQRVEIKEKILQEMKKGSEKENIFSNKERVIISNFLQKLIDELDIKSN
tara:strand:+ start:366 stop:632 length:267 start_codon:yes stop_codon:yes gene_type:complete